VSSAEEALESAIIAALNGAADVRALLGDPVRILEATSPKPAYPYLEIARHLSEPAGAAGVEASEHRIDLVVVSRLDGGTDGVRAIAAIRGALAAATVEMAGWRCVLLVPAYSDTLNRGRGLWRAILRMRAVVEAA
jgi:Protein of unknown function (DUF3168)